MGLAHESLPVHGVQFHPESIASEHGHLMLKNFLDLAAAWNAKTGRAPRADARGAMSEPAMADDFKALIAKVATGAIAHPRGGRRRLRPHDVGRGDALADGRPADGAARARRNRRRDHRRGHHHARQDAGREGAAGRDRRGRHRRRCLRLLQHLDLRGASSWRAPACRSPSTATARCRRSPAPPTCSARSASRSISTPTQVGRCIHEAGIGFMFAPAHHPAMKNVGPTRVELGTRTIFNLLGPLSNPASVKRQMIGVFSRQWIEPMAQVLEESRLGMRLGRARLRRARRDHHRRADPRGGAGKRQGPHLRDHAGGRRPAARQARGAARRRRRAQRRGARRDVLKGKASAYPRRRAAQCRGGADRRRQGQGPERRRGARAQSRSTAARPKAGSTG